MARIAAIRRFVSPEFIFREQFDYGHREILIQYCDMPADAILLGRIQHGWDPLFSEPAASFRPYALRQGWQWVWTRGAMERAQSGGLKRVQAIGAPWLYLLEIDSADRVVSKGCLGMPGHLNELSTPMYHEEFADSLIKRFKGMDISVMLHGLDFTTRSIRRVYETRGLKLDCAGWPAGTTARTPSSAIGDRPRFLVNLLEAMRSHEFIATDAIGSHLAYAGSIGKPVFLLPRDVRGSLEGRQTTFRVPPLMAGQLAEEERWKMVHLGRYVDDFIAPGTLAAIADEFLGVDSVMTAQDLKSTLRWSRLEARRIIKL